MAVLIDPPAWPAHGRLWSHLASDLSYAELHAFADRVGVPRRAFEGDHYDVPQERYDGLVAAGALPVASRDLLGALQRSGLRLPKRRGERVLATWPDGRWLRAAGPHHVDVLASPFDPPADATVGGRLLAVRGGRVALAAGDLPAAAAGHHPLGYLRARFTGPRRDGAVPWPRCFLALRGGEPPPGVDWVSLDRLGPSARYWLPLARWLDAR